MKKLLYYIIAMQLIISCAGKGGLSPELKALISNPDYASPEGKLIIGFTFPPDIDDPNSRGPLGMVPVYEGEPIPEEFYNH